MGPLEGIRVLELAEGVGGATAGMYLADLGAEVLKVEPPGGNPWSDQRGALSWNRSKRVVAEADRLGVQGLVSGADVVIVDAGASGLASAGLDAAGVQATNPEAVHLWLPAGGPVGRWSDLRPDPVLQAAVVGACWRAEGPSILSAPVVAYQQGAQGATAALAGLIGRERTGRGQAVVVSGLHALGALCVATLMYGIERAAVGGMPNYRLYVDRDEKPFAFCPLAPHFFFEALEALDLMELLVLPGFDGVYERLPLPEVAGPITERLTALFATQPREHWVSLLQEAGIPCAVVGTTAEWLASDLVADAGMRVTLEHPEYGPVVMPGVPLSFSSTPPDRLRLATSAEPRWEDRPSAGVRSLGDRRGLVEDAGAPLAGIEVLDLGTFIAGTFGPMLLSGMGADVVKVEGPAGDPYRTVPLSFFAVNRGKRSVALDLKSDEGRRALYELVGQADVVMENYRPGGAERLGISGSELLAANPRLVHTSVRAWGESGPMATMPGFDMMVGAMSGMIDAGVSVGLVHDIGTATVAALGTLAALVHRGRSGQGQLVSTSMVRHSLMAQLAEATACAGRSSNLGEGTLDARADGWWVVTPRGEARVLPSDELSSDEWVQENRMWAEVVNAQFGRYYAVREPATWPVSHSGFGDRAPAVGEHSPEVLARPLRGPAR